MKFPENPNVFKLFFLDKVYVVVKEKDMAKERIHLEDIVKRDPFKVPEGYFDTFTSELMSRLPEHQAAPTQVISFWERVKPWVYMAAMFAGIWVSIKTFTNIHNTEKQFESYAEKGLNLSSDADIEDYYNYYEEGMAKVYFDDTMADMVE
ncbi:MAG: hypothetical protein LBJ17_02030 [Dysgonamonadaceae bacterium]|jgi:hypothetical protein|nr:hypothetical protein [Dysgonamonadaceae bacterium]